MNEPHSGHTTPEEISISTQFLDEIAKVSVPLPASVSIERVRAIQRKDVKRLVSQTVALELARWEEKVAELEAELQEAVAERRETTRLELPRLAGLVEEEKTRADQLEGELILLEGRIQELECEAEAREQELESLQAAARGGAPAPELAEGADPDARVAELEHELVLLQGRIEELEAEGPTGVEADAVAELQRELTLLQESLERPADTAFEALLEEFARSEDRATRISVLEDLVWNLAEESSSDDDFKEVMQDLRRRCDELQGEGRTTEKLLRATHVEKEQLETRARELIDARDQARLELDALLARYENLEGALSEAKAELATAKGAEQQATAREEELEGHLETVEELRRSTRQSDAERVALVNTVAELEAQLDVLAAQALELDAPQDTASREAELEATVSELETALGELALEVASLHEAQDQASSRSASEGQANQQLEDELSSARLAFHEARDLIDTLEARVQAARTSLSESRLAEAALSWKLDTVEDALEVRLLAAERVFTDLERVRARAETSITERDAKLEELRGSLDESRAVARALEAELSPLKAEHDPEQVGELRASRDASQASAVALTEELERTRQRLSEQDDQTDALELELAVVKGTLEGAKSAASLMRAEALKADDGRDALDIELRSAQATSRMLEAELAAAKAELEELREQASEGAPRAQAEGDASDDEAVKIALSQVNRLRAEVHDLERALESECWRGLATHRDLVNAHQRVREFEDALQDSQEGRVEVPFDESEEAFSLRAEVTTLQGQLETARGLACEVEDAPQRDALNWLLGSPPADEAFVTEATALLPDLDRRLSDTRRYLRRTREEFRAERKTLLEGALTAERARSHAEEVGIQGETLDKRSRRATEKLRKFDHTLEAELQSLESRLHAEEDMRQWLASELGQAPPEHAAAQDDLLEEARDTISKLQQRTAQEQERRRSLESEAMQAIQIMERERATLEVELTRARAMLEEQGMVRLRLEERISKLTEPDRTPKPAAAGVADPLFSFQAERIAVLNYSINDRDSAVHWLLRELDSSYQAAKTEELQHCAEAVCELPPESSLREELLHWLGVGDGKRVNGERTGSGSQAPAPLAGATRLLPRPELPAPAADGRAEEQEAAGIEPSSKAPSEQLVALDPSDTIHELDDEP